jgi:hypothetical protein
MTLSVIPVTMGIKILCAWLSTNRVDTSLSGCDDSSTDVRQEKS